MCCTTLNQNVWNLLRNNCEHIWMLENKEKKLKKLNQIFYSNGIHTQPTKAILKGISACIQFGSFCFIFSQSQEVVWVAVPGCSSEDIFMFSQLKGGRAPQGLVLHNVNFSALQQGAIQQNCSEAN